MAWNSALHCSTVRHWRLHYAAEQGCNAPATGAGPRVGPLGALLLLPWSVSSLLTTEATATPPPGSTDPVAGTSTLGAGDGQRAAGGRWWAAGRAG